MRPTEKYAAPTWNQTYRMMLRLAQRINADGFRPDTIVAVERGGLIPARILSDLFENPNLVTLRIECYVGAHQTKPTPILKKQLSECVRGKRVLLVDDIADTGKSLKLAKEHVEESGAKEVRVATLFRKSWSIMSPDYCAKETSSWVVFPWDIKETVREAFESRGNTSVTELSEKLKEEGLPKRLVDRFLKQITGKSHAETPRR